APAIAPAATPETPVENAQPEAPAEPLLTNQAEPAPAMPAGSGAPLAAGPGYSITRGDGKDAATSPTLEGPGYSITRHEPEKREAGESAETVASNVERRT